MLDENAYLAICFVIFIALSYKPIKSIILSFLDEKIKQIKWALEHASLAKETAEKELSEMQKHMHFIEKKHKDMLEAATIAIENEFKERSKKLAANLKYLENTAASRIQQIHREASKDVEKQILEKTLSVVSSYFDKTNSLDLDLAIISGHSKTRQRKSE